MKLSIVKPAWVTHPDDKGRPSTIFTTSIHPDGTRLATGGIDTKIRIWTAGAVINESLEKQDKFPKLLCTMTTHSGPVMAVKWSNKGRYLASGSDDNIAMIWALDVSSGSRSFGETNVENWKAVKRLIGHESDITSLAWNSDDSLLASAGLDGCIYVWSGANFELIRKIDAHDGFVKGIVFDPIGQYLASQSDDNSLRIWRTDDWGMAADIREPFADAPKTSVARLSWSPDGLFIVAPNSMNGPVFVAGVIARGSWECKQSIVGHPYITEVAAFSPIVFLRNTCLAPESANLCTMFALAASGNISIWITAKDEPVAVLEDVVDRDVLDLSWSADGRHLWASSSEGHVVCVTLDFSNEFFLPAPPGALEKFCARYNFTPRYRAAPEMAPSIAVPPPDTNGSFSKPNMLVSRKGGKRRPVKPPTAAAAAPVAASSSAFHNAATGSAAAFASAPVFDLNAPHDITANMLAPGGAPDGINALLAKKGRASGDANAAANSNSNVFGASYNQGMNSASFGNGVAGGAQASVPFGTMDQSTLLQLQQLQLQQLQTQMERLSATGGPAFPTYQASSSAPALDPANSLTAEQARYFQTLLQRQSPNAAALGNGASAAPGRVTVPAQIYSDSWVGDIGTNPVSPESHDVAWGVTHTLPDAHVRGRLAIPEIRETGEAAAAASTEPGPRPDHITWTNYANGALRHTSQITAVSPAGKKIWEDFLPAPVLLVAHSNAMASSPGGTPSSTGGPSAVAPLAGYPFGALASGSKVRCVFTAVALRDASLIVYSAAGRRLLPTVVLDAPCSLLSADASFLMAITALGTLVVYDVRRSALHLRTSVRSLLSSVLEGSGAFSTASPTITTAQITENGMPIIALSSGTTFCWDPLLEAWTRVSETWWSRGSDAWEGHGRVRGRQPVPQGHASTPIRAIEAAVNDIVVDTATDLHKANPEPRYREGTGDTREELPNVIVIDDDDSMEVDANAATTGAPVQASRAGSETKPTIPPVHTPPTHLIDKTEVRYQVTLGHLETRMKGAVLLGSAGEFKAALISYARHLADEGDQGKAEELAKELIGPVYYKPDAEAMWSPTILSLSKRELAREVLSIFARSRLLTGMGSEYQDILRKINHGAY